jgi:hypothetical protein
MTHTFWPKTCLRLMPFLLHRLQIINIAAIVSRTPVSFAGYACKRNTDNQYQYTTISKKAVCHAIWCVKYNA